MLRQRPSWLRIPRATSEALRALALGLLNACIPKSPTKIVLHCFPDLGDEALVLLEDLRRRGYQPLILLEQAASLSWQGASLPAGSVAVSKNSVRGRFHYLTAGFVFTTHGIYRPHRPARRQVVVNLWHGELGKPVARFLEETPPVNATYAASLSNVGRAFTCAEFNLPPRQVLVTGAPRNDRMLRTDRRASRRTLVGVDHKSRIAVWLPTYRDRGPDKRQGNVDGSAYSGLLPLSEGAVADLDDWLCDNDSLLLVKPHPSALKPQAGRYRRIRLMDQAGLAERGLTTGELLGAADCLITDASSVWVDFLLTGKPMMFVFPDLERYRASRGLYLEPYEAWVPGPVIREEAALLPELGKWARGEDDYIEARRSATARLHRYADDQSTARLLDAVGLRSVRLVECVENRGATRQTDHRSSSPPLSPVR